MTILFNTTIINNTKDFTEQDSIEFLNICALRLKNNVASNAPGKLKESKYEVSSSNLHFESPQPYASFVNSGRPEIRPVSAKALHFWIGNKEIFCKFAKATAPQPYFDNAVIDLDENIEELFENFFEGKQ